MYLSFSKASTFLTCGRKYYYQYVQKIVPLVTSVAMPFGRAVHHACTNYIAAAALGRQTDPVRDFLASWETETQGLTLEYPADHTHESMTDVGKVMTDRFPDAWDQSQFQAIVSEDGTPLVEQKVTVPLPDGHHLVFVIDVLGIDLRSGACGVLDLKTGAQEHTEHFGYNSNQLTIYQYGADKHYSGWLGQTVSNVGFMDLLKRKPSSTGTGPLVLPARFYPRRGREAVSDMLAQLSDVAERIAQRRFYRPMSHAFNSPCNYCEFARLCIHNDTQGYSTTRTEAA